MFFDPLVLLFTISSAKFEYVVHIFFKINEAQTIYETPKPFFLYLILQGEKEC